MSIMMSFCAAPIIGCSRGRMHGWTPSRDVRPLPCFFFFSLFFMLTWGETVHGGDFHKALLNFFKLHVRLFLNSIGLFTPKPSNSAVTVCYTSAVETLYLVVNEFSKLDMLRYGQDSVSVMTAYSAVSLLKVRMRHFFFYPNKRIS